MISTTRRLETALKDLPMEKFIIAVDENDNQYAIDSIVKVKTHTDDNYEWIYGLKIHRTDGCMMR